MARSGGGGGQDDSWEYSLRKYLLLLATLVATVTYGAGFNPPGGVWQTADRAKDRIAGDPIIRETSYTRYLAFFYSNATAFASSLVVIVLILILSLLNDRGIQSPAPVRILRVVMVLDLVSLMVAYAAGTFRDALTAIYSVLLLAGVVAYLVVHLVLASWPEQLRKAPDTGNDSAPEQPRASPEQEERTDDSAPEQPRASPRQEERTNDSAPEQEQEQEERTGDSAVTRLRKVLMLLATFAASVTYVAGLSAPGGFWDHEEDGHKPGEAVLKGGPHDARLKAFFVCNTTAFVASLLILVMLLEKKLCFSKKVRYYELYGLIALMLLGLVAAYAAGGSREIDTTLYVSALVGAVAVCILVQVIFVFLVQGQESSDDNGSDEQQQQTQGPQTSNGNGSDQYEKQQNQALEKARSLVLRDNCLWKHLKGIFDSVSTTTSDDEHEQQRQTQALEKARSLVLLLATLAAAITYQAGLNPPGGLWQSDDAGGRYKNGDPILLTTNPRRYKAFYYCNSVAFVASLVAIILARMKTLHHHNALETAMILDLFGLIGAYAAGSCRDVSTSIYAMALAGAVLVYVVIHVVFLTLDHSDSSSSSRRDDQDSLEKEKKAEELVEKRRKRLLLFAILAATITYQAGLTPPGGFLVNDDGHAGDPVLLSNYWRRYKAFFYCNTVSFMLSIALIILLVNPNLYRPAIRSNALSVCTAAGLMGIMGGYAAGCTQHIKTSIYIFALAAAVLCSVVVLVAVFFVMHRRKQEDDKSSNTAAAESPGEGARVETIETATGAEQYPAPDAVAGQGHKEEKRLHAKRKYLMLLGILAASVTYQAGLAPPGGAWQFNDDTHTAGNPVMHDNRRPRYLAFFYSNSTSFVASVVVIVLLLPPSLHEKPWWLGVMNTTIVLDLLGLLIAYAAGSSRSWKTSGYVSTLVIPVLAYFAIHVMLSCFSRRRNQTAQTSTTHDPNDVVNDGHQAQVAPSIELPQAI